ncbi:MAG: ribonuclease Y [Verrucomicrobiota bacterium]
MYLEISLSLLLGATVGAWVYAVALKKRFNRADEARRQNRELEDRQAQLSLREKAADLELELQKKQADLERKISLKRDELERAVSKISEREKLVEEKEKGLVEEQATLDTAAHEAEKTQRLYKMRLQQISQMEEADARRLLIKATEKECEKEILTLRKQMLERSESEITDEARRILLASMQRITSQPMNDATATVVALPSEEMKGRIIGREGRNIRTFEHATGTTLMIDETPDSVLISCFDPVRREIARMALEALVRDGRIHPASIEEEVLKAEDEMDANVIELGEGALRKLRLHDVHPEIVSLLGRLNYRLSNNQNTLAHSVEVGNLCALIASEIGLDPSVAKRAGLLHDMGKAIDEDYEGSHAIAGASVAKQHGEESRVVNAIAAHHQEVPAESAYAGLVMVADSLSAVRPGARASSIDGFIQRVRSIEIIAQEERGVTEAYAIQAGREVRVIVEPSKVEEEEARQIARRIRSRIENELNYPGSIEVTVIREQRFTETAV